MARRKEVFQSKVLQKLYPAAPTLKKEPSPPSIVDTLSKKAYVKRKASQRDTAIGGAETAQSAATPGRRVYTVLPPPADYKPDSEKSITLPQSESINSAEDPAEEDLHGSNEDKDKEEEEHKRKRRRRKRKPTPQQDSRKDRVSESSPGQSQTPVDEGGERISKNKKRKLKKKRHKEKLLSMGLMPRAAALEFTYRKDEEQEEEEEEEDDDERRAAEVSDFLRTTLEIYTSDSSSHTDKLPFPSGAVDDLLSSISSACKPTSVLQRLYGLKALVQQRETDKLEEALEELCNTSPMSAEETTAVVSLFKYWITDVFPMQGDTATALSTLHP